MATSSKNAVEAATIRKGQSLNTIIKGEDDLILAQKYKTWLQLFVGTFSLAMFSSIVVTWIFKFGSDKQSVLISLFQIPILVEFIFAAIVIPLYYRYWTKRRPKSGLSVMLAFMFMEGLSILCNAASIFWRIIVWSKPEPAVDLVLFVIACLSTAVSITGLVLGGLLRRQIEKTAMMKLQNRLVAITVDPSDNEIDEIELEPLRGSEGHQRRQARKPKSPKQIKNLEHVHILPPPSNPLVVKLA